jgi:hypothetical protein
LVAPDERGTDPGIGAIQDDETVHLPGEADAFNLIARDARGGEHTADGGNRGIPPILGPLLSPYRALHAHLLMGRREPRADAAAFVYQEGARTARSNIDAKIT